MAHRRFKWSLTGAAGAIFVAGLARPEGARADWPQWRGPDRSGVSTDTGLLKEWPAGGPRLVWTAAGAGQGYSSVAIAGRRLFTCGCRGKDEFLSAYDLDTGRSLWSCRIGPRFKNRYGDGPRSTPTVDGGRVYVLGASGDLLCAEAASGRDVWRLNILREFGGRNIKWGLSESVLIDGDRLFCLPGGDEGGMVALAKRDGKLIWRSKAMTDSPAYASALLVERAGLRQVVQVTDRGLVGVRAEDGRLLWRYDRAANDVANCTTPIHHDGRVFVCSAYDTGGALLKLRPTGDGLSAEEVYFTRDMMNHHGGVVLLDGHLYGFSNNVLVCLEFDTGRLVWRDRSVGKGSLTAADGMLYCLGEKGVVGLVRASPTAYQEVSRFSIEVDGANSWAHPVVTGGRLYIRNGDQVLCYDVQAK